MYAPAGLGEGLHLHESMFLLTKVSAAARSHRLALLPPHPPLAIQLLSLTFLPCASQVPPPSRSMTLRNVIERVKVHLA